MSIIMEDIIHEYLENQCSVYELEYKPEYNEITLNYFNQMGDFPDILYVKQIYDNEHVLTEEEIDRIFTEEGDHEIPRNVDYDTETESDTDSDEIPRRIEEDGNSDYESGPDSDLDIDDIDNLVLAEEVKKVLKKSSLKQTKMAKGDSKSVCPICLDTLKKVDKVRVLKCDHKYHPDCIDNYLLTECYLCPYCKTPAGEYELINL
jgi:hypothetical protein